MNEWMNGEWVTELKALSVQILCCKKTFLWQANTKMFFIDMKSETYSTFSHYHGFAFKTDQYYLHKGGK